LPYFVPDLLTQQRLIKAARHGIDSWLLVPSKTGVPTTRWRARAFASAIMLAEIRICEYLPTAIYNAETLKPGH
jgi:phosphatidylserine/phosphatidylglycerophosphate/cardiolipin synthase-like enzyme